MSIKKTSSNKNSTISIEEQYKSMTPEEHILKLSDTYIGSKEADNKTMYIYDDEEERLCCKDKVIIMGLYKIFDEILVNAADNTVRDKKCNVIKVNIDQSSGEIQVMNNGSSIPVEIHKDEKMYVPEMIFGKLLTSGNYEQKGKVVGGKNGYGAKLANIFSQYFDVEIWDTVRNLKYYQRFSENMYKKEQPLITQLPKGTKESMTKITFLPDYERFNIKNITPDMISLLKKRVYDIAGTTDNSVKVYYNDELIPIKSFEDYIKLHYPNNEENNNVNLVYADVNDRWSVGVVYDTTSGYQHVSFVNRIATFEGGTHVNYIVNQIVDKVTNVIREKNKNLKVKPSQIKDNITVFINCVVEDPSFSSQTKESLTTKASTFNIKCELDDKFIAKLCKTGLYEEIVQLAQIKQLAELEKSDGKKNISLRKLVKLNDARLAGTKHSPECRLILTEGDSAKSFAISGLDKIGKDKYGIFPLRGKLLNVRDATPKQLLANEEIKNIKQIMGLKQNTIYKDTKKLRYGGIVILTDADADGSHIKGLLMNFFHFFWPSLLKINGFIQTLSTPIIKVFKKSDNKKKCIKEFYTQSDYKDWVNTSDEVKQYEVKYYKGLGTSTEQEAKECFTDFDKKIITYVWDDTKLINNVINNINEDNETTSSKDDKEEFEDEGSITSMNSDQVIDKNDKAYQALTLAFAKQRSNDRKEWLKQYKSDLVLDNNNKFITFHEFINKDLIHFSNSDIIRSIPDICDGLKPSQRKILYGSFKRKLHNQEIKVAQLSGYIAEHTEYHHGEISLQGAIINMAQNFVGSNNLNLLNPNGNFGTRRLGGKDASSSRYIFTQLNEVTKYIYKQDDESVLVYNYEDGVQIEPTVYYPIIPMVLVNGAEGIGTGFSTFIPSYNPIDIVENIKKYLVAKSVNKDAPVTLNELHPWYRGFTGQVTKLNEDTWQISGSYKIINENTIKISELPVGMWTETYREYLEELIDEGTIINNYDDNSNVQNVDITIYFINNALQQLIKCNSIEKKLKLSTTVKTSNMHLYKNNIITKYKNANQILDDFIKIRLEMYDARKNHIIKILLNELNIIKYRKMFIEQILDKEIVIERKKKEEIIQTLKDNNYPELSFNINNTTSYDYLTNLPLWSLTFEKIEDMIKDYNNKKLELDTYTNTSVENLWLHELELLEESYDKYLLSFEKENLKDSKIKNKTIKKNNVSVKKNISIKTN